MKLKHLGWILLITLTITACSKGNKGDMGLQGIPAIAPIVDSIDAQIASLLSDENTYRLSLGQTELSAGLSCSIQAINAGQWLLSSSPGYQSSQGVLTLAGSSYGFLLTNAIDQPNNSGGSPNSLLPSAVQPLFLNINYKLNCSGQIVVLDTDYYSFDVNSDDGSILTIDGTQVVNNDGNHGMVDKTGTKLLRRGVHSFNLLYAQTGGGNFGLVLHVNGSDIESRFFAH